MPYWLIVGYKENIVKFVLLVYSRRKEKHSAVLKFFLLLCFFFKLGSQTELTVVHTYLLQVPLLHCLWSKFLV